ncbi:hypothetical protein EVU91_01435 [Macrococcoides bohemicum]|uniref:hypothetical protein n=1 Tax=Macrococcoides bohemicum TaxID=1903056 RepID=UPI001059B58F|nr:hypothetical protein [Macrococcus bohemicus]TDL40581.1 hypothetical protein EVU91_01435 [Macrococcus bohemicus]
MKNFDDFLLTISTKEVELIMENANESIETLRNGDKDSPTHLGNQIGGLAFTINLELLRRYHEWLQQVD